MEHKKITSKILSEEFNTSTAIAAYLVVVFKFGPVNKHLSSGNNSDKSMDSKSNNSKIGAKKKLPRKTKSTSRGKHSTRTDSEESISASSRSGTTLKQIKTSAKQSHSEANNDYSSEYSDTNCSIVFRNHDDDEDSAKEATEAETGIAQSDVNAVKLQLSSLLAQVPSFLCISYNIHNCAAGYAEGVILYKSNSDETGDHPSSPGWCKRVDICVRLK